MITTKFFAGILDQFDVGERIAVDQQQIGQRAFLDHAELARIGTAKPDSASSSPLSAVAIFSSLGGLYQRVIMVSCAPWRGANLGRTACRCPRRS